MARFVEIGNRYLNVDKIQSFRVIDDKRISVIYTDGECEYYDHVSDYTVKSLTGNHHIVQVIPSVEPIYAVWYNSADGHYTERMNFLALCADGEIYGLSLSEGWFEILDHNVYSSYKGLYGKEDLDKLIANTSTRENPPPHS